MYARKILRAVISYKVSRKVRMVRMISPLISLPLRLKHLLPRVAIYAVWIPIFNLMLSSHPQTSNSAGLFAELRIGV